MKQFETMVLFDKWHQTISLNKKICHKWESTWEEILAGNYVSKFLCFKTMSNVNEEYFLQK